MSVFAELSDEALAILKEAGHDIETFVMDELSKLIGYLRDNEPLVTKTLNLFADMQSKAMTGSQKMAKVVGDITDIAEEVVAEGGPMGIVSRGENDIRAFAQSVFADFQADVASIGKR